MSKLLDLINKYEESNNFELIHIDSIHIKSIHEKPVIEKMLNTKKQQQLTDLIQNCNENLNFADKKSTKKSKNKLVNKIIQVNNKEKKSSKHKKKIF